MPACKRSVFDDVYLPLNTVYFGIQIGREDARRVRVVNRVLVGGSTPRRHLSFGQGHEQRHYTNYNDRYYRQHSPIHG